LKFSFCKLLVSLPGSATTFRIHEGYKSQSTQGAQINTLISQSQQNILELTPQEILNLFHNDLSSVCRHAFILLHDMFNKYAWRLSPYAVCPSQSYIAQKLGISREWANKILHRLQTMGLIVIINRGVKKTCAYIPSPWLNAKAASIINRVHTIKDRYIYLLSGISREGENDQKPGWFRNVAGKISDFFQKKGIINPRWVSSSPPTDQERKQAGDSMRSFLEQIKSKYLRK
jgi:hypothetical protein